MTGHMHRGLPRAAPPHADRPCAVAWRLLDAARARMANLHAAACVLLSVCRACVPDPNHALHLHPHAHRAELERVPPSESSVFDFGPAAVAAAGTAALLNTGTAAVQLALPAGYAARNASTVLMGEQ